MASNDNNNDNNIDLDMEKDKKMASDDKDSDKSNLLVMASNDSDNDNKTELVIASNDNDSDKDEENEQINDDNNKDENFAPSTVLVMLGPLHFDHSKNADVLSVKITTPEELKESIEKAANMLEPDSLDTFHVILKSSTVSSLFDEIVLTSFVDALRADSEITIHVLGSEDMPVQPGDVEEIRMALLMANLRLLSEEGDEGGSLILSAKKSGKIIAVDDGDY